MTDHPLTRKEKILIRTPNWLGDLMMSTAFIKAVLQLYPNTLVDLIVRNGFEQIPLPHRGKIIPFDKSKVSAYSFGASLKQERYSKVYVLPPSFSSALMAYSARIPTRIGYSGSLRGLLLNKSKTYQKVHRSQHLIQEYLQLLDGYSEVSDSTPGLDLNDQWVDHILSQLTTKIPDSFITIAPGVMYGPAKQWPVEYFDSVIRQLTDKGERILIIGTDGDVELGNKLVGESNKVINICGKTNLNQLIALLAKSKLLVSNDSGTMHIMAALKKPQIAIFGSTSTIWTGPVNSKAAVLKIPIDCSPCFSRTCRFGHYDCLKEITPENVMETALTMIKE